MERKIIKIKSELKHEGKSMKEKRQDINGSLLNQYFLVLLFSKRRILKNDSAIIMKSQVKLKDIMQNLCRNLLYS